MLVGRPVAGVQVAVSALDAVGAAHRSDSPTKQASPARSCVRGPHVKDHYDQLWATQRRVPATLVGIAPETSGTSTSEGGLWIEGRLAHIVTTPAGAVTPVALEQRVERLAAVRLAAVVGVGPRGTQVVVVVVEAPLHVIRGSPPSS